MKKLISIGVLFLVAGVLAYPAQFSLKLTGGINWMSGSDYNAGIKGLNDYLKATYPPVAGAFQTLDTATKFQGEAIFQIAPNIGLGIGGGYYQIKKNDTVTYVAAGYTDTVNYSPDFSVIPLFLNLHILIPAGSMLNIDLYAGPALYLTNLKWTDSDKWVLWNLSHTFSSTGTAFGFQAGAGLDIHLAPIIAIVLDASYHFGKLNEVKGTWTQKGTFIIWSYDDSFPNSYLWYYMNGTYPQIELNPNQPSSSGSRKAAIDLSGIALTAGIKISL